MSQMFVGFSIPIQRALATSFLAFFEVLSFHYYLSFLPRVSTFPRNTIQERARCTTHIPFLRINESELLNHRIFIQKKKVKGVFRPLFHLGGKRDENDSPKRKELHSSIAQAEKKN